MAAKKGRGKISGVKHKLLAGWNVLGWKKLTEWPHYITVTTTALTKRAANIISHLIAVMGNRKGGYSVCRKSVAIFKTGEKSQKKHMKR